MNEYEARIEAKRDRMNDRADRLENEGAARAKRGWDSLHAIPFGQPILIGHHSEKRDRNYRGKACNNIDKGHQMERDAEQLRARADGFGKHGISSDDPEAVVKLKEKLAGMEESQATMRAANRIIRAKPKNEVTDAKLAKLAEIGIKESMARQLFEPDFCKRIGFADYQLSNNNANIKRVRDRIATLARKPTESREQEIGGVRIVQNAEANRLQVFFPGKPGTEVRAELKSSGFRWAPSVGAWQRHISTNAKWSAEYIVKKYFGQ